MSVVKSLRPQEDTTYFIPICAKCALTPHSSRPANLHPPGHDYLQILSTNLLSAASFFSVCASNLMPNQCSLTENKRRTTQASSQVVGGIIYVRIAAIAMLYRSEKERY